MNITMIFEDGLVLSPEILLAAYSEGIFPMGMEDGSIAWFAPKLRGILPLEPRRWPHGIRRDCRAKPWEIRCDCAFSDVMRLCAARPETWINECILASYLQLHRLGFAHSVEVWLDEQLVGGLYGVHLGAAFFGESMFHIVSGASKVALVALVEGLTQAGFQLLDTQWKTSHLEQFGCVEIPRKKYEAVLRRAVEVEIEFPKAQIRSCSAIRRKG